MLLPLLLCAVTFAAQYFITRKSIAAGADIGGNRKAVVRDNWPSASRRCGRRTSTNPFR
jgi:hypothetical protein